MFASALSAFATFFVGVLAGKGKTQVYTSFITERKKGMGKKDMIKERV